MFDDDGLTLLRGDTRVNLANLIADVVQRARSAIVDDMDDFRALCACLRQQGGRFIQRGLPAVQLHHAARVGVLVVHQDHGGLRQGGGLRVQPIEFA